LSAATRESPASAVYVTLKKVFGVAVLDVSDPGKNPALGSWTVLFFTMLLIPRDVDPSRGQQQKSDQRGGQNQYEAAEGQGASSNV
jgi:hypothetical protein